MSHLVQQHTLSNGVPAIFTFMPEIESVSTYFAYSVGARHEDKSVNGISHFLEHMAFNGTATRTSEDILFYAEDIGAMINAATSKYYTYYKATSHKDALTDAIKLLSDITTQSIFPEDQVLKERDVILEEIKQKEDTPQGILTGLSSKSIFGDCALGRTVLGYKENVANITQEQLKKYFSNNYHAGNLIVSIAGNVDPVKAISDLEQNLVPLINTAEKIKTIGAEFNPTIVTHNKDFAQTHLRITFEASTEYEPENSAAEDVLGRILGGGMASRLFQEVREKRGLAYSVGAGVPAFGDVAQMAIVAKLNAEKVSDALLAIQEIIEGASNVSEHEVERAKRVLKTRFALARETVEEYASGGFKDILQFGEPYSSAKRISYLDSVTTDEVKLAAERIFTGKPALAAVGPEASIEDVKKAYPTLGV